MTMNQPDDPGPEMYGQGKTMERMSSQMLSGNLIALLALALVAGVGVYIGVGFAIDTAKPLLAPYFAKTF